MYNFTATEFASFPASDIADMLELDTDFFSAFTPTTLRAWVKTNRGMYDRMRMRDLLRDWAGRCAPHDEKQEWDGFSDRKTACAWLRTFSDLLQAAMQGHDINRPMIGEIVVPVDPEAAAREAAAAEAAEAAERNRKYAEFLRAEALKAPTTLACEVVEIADDFDPMPTAPIPAPVREERQPVQAAVFDLEDMPSEDLLEGTEQLAQHKAAAELFLPAARASQLTLPHIIMRSPLMFTGARNAARKVYTKDAPMRIGRVSGFRTGTVEMAYIGEELRASDLETYAHVLRLAATVPLGNRLPTIKVSELLRKIGRDKSTPANRALVDQLNRLRNAEIRLWTSDATIIAAWSALFPDEPLFKREGVEGVQVSFKMLGDLVETKSEKGNTVEFSTEVSRYVRVFFGQKLSSWYSESTYRELSGDLAKRLFLFYQSHDGSFDFTFDELVEYLGASGSRDAFRDSLKAAHDELTTACFIKGWSLKASEKRGGQKAYVLQGLTTKRAPRQLDEVAELEAA
ncbi:hypothetical protein SAMN05446935_0337 [Burkholderia sp. YR290]|nr:hypothetical protein SAMN05446935_0337 [Burkholderia sp. YR290]